MQVCVQCEKYGKEVQRPKKSTLTKGSARPIVMPAAKRRRDVFDMIVGEIVEDYGERIRKARMEKGWTTKELALELKERELLIKRIEKGDLIPEDEVREKLEKALGIRLIEGAAEEEAKRKQGQVVTHPRGRHLHQEGPEIVPSQRSTGICPVERICPRL